MPIFTVLPGAHFWEIGQSLIPHKSQLQLHERNLSIPAQHF
jgi:hypothetical protein